MCYVRLIYIEDSSAVWSFHRDLYGRQSFFSCYITVMESLAYNYAMEDTKAMFSTANEANLPTAPEGAPASHAGQPASPDPGYAPAPFHAHSPNDVLNMFAQEPRPADVAPPSELDELTMNFGRMGGSEINFDDVDASNHNYLNYFMQGSRAESVTSSRNNAWADGSGPRPNDQMSTFDFLVKSVSAANNYVSMLTREQLHVLQSLRPSLLFEFLQEVAKVRSDKRMRRALPNECAFCKNNGENEECYSQHALKDWRGRVLCPVLRAFRCPRCGATGDRAHTIKYCPENSDAVLERSSGLGARRRAPPSASLPLSSGGGMSSGMSSMPQTPTHSGPPPSPSTFNSGLWSSFGLN